MSMMTFIQRQFDIESFMCVRVESYVNSRMSQVLYAVHGILIDLFVLGNLKRISITFSFVKNNLELLETKISSIF